MRPTIRKRTKRTSPASFVWLPNISGDCKSGLAYRTSPSCPTSTKLFASEPPPPSGASCGSAARAARAARADPTRRGRRPRGLGRGAPWRPSHGKRVFVEQLEDGHGRRPALETGPDGHTVRQEDPKSHWEDNWMTQRRRLTAMSILGKCWKATLSIR